jgi:ribulose-phosphate 3-epimerase
VANLPAGIATPELSVGIVNADLLRVAEELERLAGAGVSLLHVDVMDGVFCPQMTVGPPLVAALPDPFVVDVHLMIVDPLEKVEAYVAAGADIVTFHVESTPDARAVLERLAGQGVTRGVAVNPDTPVSAIRPLLDELELVLLLAVRPGVSGQSFSPATFDRLEEVRELVGGRDVLVGVDGGVTLDNASAIGEHTPDLLVAGSAVFKADDLGAAVTALRGALGKT